MSHSRIGTFLLLIACALTVPGRAADVTHSTMAANGKRFRWIYMVQLLAMATNIILHADLPIGADLLAHGKFVPTSVG